MSNPTPPSADDNKKLVQYKWELKRSYLELSTIDFASDPSWQAIKKGSITAILD